MGKVQFKNNITYKPITDEQYESLTNEFIVELNKLVDPLKMEADFVAAILANVIHSPEQKKGLTTKVSLFDGCVDMISRRLSFNISEAIRRKTEAAQKAQGAQPDGSLPEATSVTLQAVPELFDEESNSH